MGPVLSKHMLSFNLLSATVLYYAESVMFSAACTVRTGKESNPTLINSLHSRHARYAEQSDVLALHYRFPAFVLLILSRVLACTESWTRMRPHFLLPAVYLAQLRGTRPSLAFEA